PTPPPPPPPPPSSSPPQPPLQGTGNGGGPGGWPGGTRRALLVGGAIALGAALVGGTTVILTNSNNAAATLTLNFTYSTEKRAWMEQVIGDFNKSNTQVGNKPVQIQGDPRGSVDAMNRILSGDLKPIAWSPASDLELNQLISGWQKKHSGKDVVFTS